MHLNFQVVRDKLQPSIARIKLFLSKLRHLFSLQKIVKAFVIMAVIGISLFSLAVATVYVSISSQDIKSFIEKNIAEQTGGKCVIEALELSVWTGIKMQGFHLYPPAEGDLRGYLSGGRVSESALLKIEAVELGFQSAKLLLATLHVPAAKMIKPELYVAKTSAGDSWNFSSILQYREKHFPPQPVKAPIGEQPTNQRLELDKMFPSWLRVLFLPLHVKIENVGFEDLQLEFRDRAEGQDSIVYFKGLDVLAEASAFATSSRVALVVKGHEKDEIDFSMERYDHASKGAKNSIIQSELSLNMRFSFNDLKRIELDLALLVKRLLKDQSTYSNLPANLSTKIYLQPNLTGVKIEKLNFSLLKALTYDFSGDINFPNNDFSLLRLKLRQDLEIILDELNTYLQQTLPDNKITGKAKLARLSIDGDVEPGKISKDHIELPFISAIFALEKINMDLPAFGLVASDINANFALAAGRSMVGAGSQLDAVFDFSFESLFYQMVDQSNAAVSVVVKDFITKLISRVHYPKPEMPFFKFSAHAKQIIGSGLNIETIDVPFDFEMDADFRENFDKASVSLRTQLAKLLTFSLYANCKSKCSESKLDAWFELDSLKKLFLFVRPIMQKFISLKYVPDNMEGSVLAKLNLAAEVPSPLTTPWQDMLQQGKANYAFEFNINDVRVDKQPFVLEGFTNRLRFEGDFVKQKLFLKQLFEKVRFALPSSSDGKKKIAEIQNYKFETSLENELLGALDLKNPLKKMRQNLGTKLYLGLIDMADMLPVPLSSLQVSFDASMDKLSKVKLDPLRLIIPDLGMKTTFVAETTLQPNMQPKNLSAKLRLLVDQKETKSLISNIKTTGSLKCNIDAVAEDLNNLAVNGEIGFDHFFLVLPNAKELTNPLLIVEDMNGEIPLKQNINLVPLLAAKSKAPSARDNSNEVEDALDGNNLAKEDEEEKTYAISQEEFEAVSEDYFKRSRDTISENTNRIALVDYQNVRPFFPGRHPLSIERIKTANLEFKRMEFDVELKQHWFALNQYLIDFLGGKIQGDVQFAFDPKPHAVRASVHLTHLDTRKLLAPFPKLQDRAKSWGILSNPYLDGNFHLKYDLVTGAIDGGIEITSIGQEQLKMILYYIDPKEEQATISQIRTALNFGEIRHVSIPIRNGLIGLKVDVRVLAAPIPIPELRGFPIAQLVQNFRDQSKTIVDPAMDETKADETGEGAAADNNDKPPSGSETKTLGGGDDEVPIVH